MALLLMISDFEKYIYNTHLKASRLASGKPFKLRKDFTKISEDYTFLLKKLSNFFNKHKEINIETFFNSPYKLYSEQDYFDLKYFTTLKSIKTYTTYLKHLSSQDPDSDEQINFCKLSLKFIFNFCVQNNIYLKNYTLHRTNNIYTFILHLKDRKINLLSLFYFDNFETAIKNSDRDLLCFMFGDSFFSELSLKKIKFLNSIRCKDVVSKGFNIIKNKLEKELNSSSFNLSS